MRDIAKYTDDYNQPNFEDYQVEFRRKKILEIIDKYKPQTILEIGCGMEPLFQFLNYKFEKYVIVEPSEVFYGNAVKKADKDKRIICHKKYFGIDHIEFNLEFDMIICSSLLHEVDRPQELLDAIRNICTENTVVHINVPNANSFHRLLAKKMGLIKDEHEMSERNLLYQQHEVFDTASLAVLLAQTGFEVVESGGYFVKPFTHDQMYQMMKNNIIDEKVLDGLYLMTEYLPDLASEIYINCKKGEN